MCTPRWLQRALAPWFQTVTDIQDAVLVEIPAQLARMETMMADTSALLDQVAEGINNLGQPVADLIAENVRLAARNAELEGEDAAETDAADRVKSAFEQLAARFSSPEVPDVEPLPEPEPEPAPEG